MTFRDYIKSGHGSIPALATALGVSTHAVRKWVYGQREPTLTTALEIVRISDGKVDLSSLTKAAPGLAA